MVFSGPMIDDYFQNIHNEYVLLFFPSFIEVWLTNNNYIYLRCTMWCFDIRTHCEMLELLSLQIVQSPRNPGKFLGCSIMTAAFKPSLAIFMDPWVYLSKLGDVCRILLGDSHNHSCTGFSFSCGLRILIGCSLHLTLAAEIVLKCLEVGSMLPWDLCW